MSSFLNFILLLILCITSKTRVSFTDSYNDFLSNKVKTVFILKHVL